MLSDNRKKELECIFNQEDECPLELNREEQEYWNELVFQCAKKTLNSLWQSTKAGTEIDE